MNGITIPILPIYIYLPEKKHFFWDNLLKDRDITTQDVNK